MPLVPEIHPYRDQLLTLKKHNRCGIDAPSSANKLGSQPINLSTR